VHVIDEEGKMEETQPLPAQPSCKDDVMVLSLLDAVVSSVDTDDRTVKTMNCNIACPKCTKTSKTKVS
jgi:hypothetical protein